jgi:hypothetical protein
VKRNAVFWIALFALSASAAHAQGPNLQGRCSPPTSGFISDSAETPVRLTFGTLPLAQIQQQLDAARAADANSPIVLTLTGTYLVTGHPLTLPSKISLVLYGALHAFPGAPEKLLGEPAGFEEIAVNPM